MAALGLAGCSSMVAFIAGAASQGPLDDIPTRIVVPGDPVEYPDPICLGCKIVTKRASASDEADDGSGVMTVTYRDQTTSVFVGDVMITVFLLDVEEHRTVILEHLRLVDGQTIDVSLPPAEDWSWSDVELVWVELLPTS